MIQQKNTTGPERSACQIVGAGQLTDPLVAEQVELRQQRPVRVEPVDLVAGNAAAHGLENVDIMSFSRNSGEQGILFLTERS